MKPIVIQTPDGYPREIVYEYGFSDMTTPISLLRAVKAKYGKCFLLESAQEDEWSRYSFLGYDPCAEIVIKDGVTTVTENGREDKIKGDPNEAIRGVLKRYATPNVPDLPPFIGGLCGYFGYEYFKYGNKIEFNSRDVTGAADARLFAFDKIIAFDSYKQRIYFIVNAAKIGFSLDKAQGVIEEMKKLAYSPDGYENDGFTVGEFKGEFTEADYCRVVERVKSHIKEGDIFQAVPSNLKSADCSGSLVLPYRRLRTVNPSPYMFYMSMDDFELCGASPETLIKNVGGQVTTFPIAGSSPRGAGVEEDEARRVALLSDEKELAEHNMLVDLGRNDLGKVCKFGSVEVREYKRVLKFSHIMHITSTVVGTLKSGCDSLDAVSAVLPAGTLSGAPKKRACEIIDEEEGIARGVYGGAVGYLSFMGDCDLCIAIRMAVKNGDKVYVRAGGGVVFDSVPKNEFAESENKLAAMQLALRGEV